MTRRRRQLSLQTRLGIAIALVVILLLVLVIFGTFSNKNVITAQNKTQDVNELEQTQSQATSPTRGQDRLQLCESYDFKQGDSLNLDGHEVIVERIAKQGVKLSVDGEQQILSLGESHDMGDGLLVELEKGAIVFFEVDDADNTATLVLGCQSEDEESWDKYVREKGEEVCEELYRQCTSSFDVN